MPLPKSKNSKSKPSVVAADYHPASDVTPATSAKEKKPRKPDSDVSGNVPKRTKSKPVPDPVLLSEQESEPEDFVKLVKSFKGKKTATEHYIEEEEENEEWLEGKEDGEGEQEQKEDRKCHENCFNFANFLKPLKGKQKAMECHVEGEGESEEEEEEWEEDEKEGEEDELDLEEEKLHEDRKVIHKS